MPIKLGDDGYWVPYLMGRGSARVKLWGMGRGNDAKTALGVMKETK